METSFNNDFQAHPAISVLWRRKQDAQTLLS